MGLEVSVSLSCALFSWLDFLFLWRNDNCFNPTSGGNVGLYDDKIGTGDSLPEEPAKER